MGDPPSTNAFHGKPVSLDSTTREVDLDFFPDRVTALTATTLAVAGRDLSWDQATDAPAVIARIHQEQGSVLESKTLDYSAVEAAPTGDYANISYMVTGGARIYALWEAGPSARLLSLDHCTLDVLASVPWLGGQLRGLEEMAFDSVTNTVWLPTDGFLSAFDGVTLAEVTQVPLEFPGCITATAGEIWASGSRGDGTGWGARVDTATGTVTDLASMAVNGGCIQSTSTGELYFSTSMQLVKLDAAGEPTTSLALPAAAVAGFANEQTWVLAQASATELVGITVTELPSGDQAAVDWAPNSLQIYDATATASNIWFTDFEGNLWAR